MIDRETAQLVLEQAVATGGDFAELFAEDTMRSNMKMIDDKLDTAIKGKRWGAGVRVFKGLRSVYATTNDLSRDGLLACAKKAAAAIGDSAAVLDIVLTPTVIETAHPVKLPLDSVALADKAALIRSAYGAIKAYSPEIVQAITDLIEWDQTVLIANTEGIFATDRRAYTRLFNTAVASDGTENQTGYDGPGRSAGFECFEEIDVQESARGAAQRAVTMLHARNCPAGRMPVAIDNGFGGVIFHEACGHSLEATSVAKGNSEFSGRLGEVIANPKVSATDDGTLPGNWGSLNIDDEGTPAQRNVLIQDGVLKGYLIDKLGGRRMEMAPTGSGRRESYQYAPTSRMTNTFIENGPDKNEDIIASIDNGLYAKRMGGGSVNPATGEFNFAVSEGYLVKNGKITEPVRGASLIGKGSQILLDIDMVGQNLALSQGMCGSESGTVPTNVGQPMIRVREITVGGR
ncbi:TldD/PmbA family protein [Ruminococcaceae bacterium OttesenSCG-928-L11]|nr:TldD/PmbA family protein [Ruminococcaceae bacterium OttesenSCG-928-L11]